MSGDVISKSAPPRAATLAFASILLAGCAGPLIGPGQSSPPNPGRPQEEPPACPGALLEGDLLADDGDGFLVRHEEGFITPVVWPEGYTVRDGDVRELLDAGGRVVAREGDFVSAGGGMTGNNEAFRVCGEFRITPAD
jgi:hypothetical protein